jgi:four helix bundle protein
MQSFRTYQLSLKLYRDLKSVQIPYSIKDQLHRAAASVCLNLAEGSAKPTLRDRKKFYSIAFGSLREVQAVLAMENLAHHSAIADRLAASLYKLTRC